MLLDDDSGHAFLDEYALQRLQQILDDNRRQPLARVVEQQRDGIAGERPRDGDELLLAARQASGDALDDKNYLALERPSENVAPHLYVSVDGKLFQKILELCVEPGKMCASQMAAIDARGGLGLAGIANTLPLSYDKFARRGAVFGDAPSFVASICEPASPDMSHLPAQVAPPTPRHLSPLRGYGLARPVSFSQTLN